MLDHLVRPLLLARPPKTFLWPNFTQGSRLSAHTPAPPAPTLASPLGPGVVPLWLPLLSTCGPTFGVPSPDSSSSV